MATNITLVSNHGVRCHLKMNAFTVQMIREAGAKQIADILWHNFKNPQLRSLGSIFSDYQFKKAVAMLPTGDYYTFMFAE